MTCDEIKDRLVDYLYGELPDSERQAFEAHLPGCPGCRDDVAGLGATLARTRAAVRTTSEEPPPRVRAAILAAAAAHAAPAAAVPIEAGDPQPGLAGRLWAWLRRPWILPAFAAASVMGIFVLARQVILAPERVAGVRVMERAEPAPAAPVMLEGAGPSSGAEDKAKEEAAADERGRLGGAPRPRGARTADRGAARDDLLDTALARREAKPKAAKKSRTVASYAPRPVDLRVAAAPAEAPAPVQSPPEVMAPPPAATPPAAAPAASGAGLAVRSAPPPEAEAEPAPQNAPARHFAARPPAPAPAAQATAAPPPPKTVAASAEKGNVVRRKAPLDEESARDVRPASYDDLLRRADAAFADQRWAEASRSYRELLHRFPTHRNAPAWKGRLAACLQQLAR
jgi:anti-sigma factor RsiW